MIAQSLLRGASRRLEKEIKSHALKLEKAGVRALNKTATSVRQASSVEVRQTLNIKASFVKRLLVIRKARRGNMRSSIEATYKKVPVIQFSGVRQTKKGVSVRMRKDKPRKTFSSAFIATMPSGHKGVFRRSLSAKKRTKGRPATSSPNLKITEIHGPNVQGIFADKTEKLLLIGNPILEKNINRELEYELSK